MRPTKNKYSMFETKKKLIEWLDQMELTIGKAQWRTNVDCNQEFAAYIS